MRVIAGKVVEWGCSGGIRGLSKVPGGGPLTCPPIASTPPLSLSLSLLSPPSPQPLPLWECAHVLASLYSGWERQIASTRPHLTASAHTTQESRSRPCSVHASQHQPSRPQPWAESEVWTQAPGFLLRWSWSSVYCPGLSQALFAVTRPCPIWQDKLTCATDIY